MSQPVLAPAPLLARSLRLVVVFLCLVIGLLLLATPRLTAAPNALTITPAQLSESHASPPQTTTRTVNFFNPTLNVDGFLIANDAERFIRAVEPISSVVLPFQTVSVDVGFNSTGLDAGPYRGYLLIATYNNGNIDSRYYTVTLTVGSPPYALLTPATLNVDFDRPVPYTARYVVNLNSPYATPRSVTGELCGPPAPPGLSYTLPTSLPANTTRPIDFSVDWAQMPSNTYTSTLCLNFTTGTVTDTAQLPMTLTRTSELPPAIAVEPQNLTTTVAMGGVMTRTVTLSNTGEGELIYALATRPDADCNADPNPLPWAEADPVTGTVAGGQSVPLTVTFDATGLGVGGYNGVLCVYNNSFDTGGLPIPTPFSTVTLDLNVTAPTTPTPTATGSVPPSVTPTATQSATPSTVPPTVSPSVTATGSVIPPSVTPSVTATGSVVPPSATASATATASTVPPTVTPSATATGTATQKRLYLPLVRTE